MWIRSLGLDFEVEGSLDGKGALGVWIGKDSQKWCRID